MRNNELSKQILREAEKRFKNKNMKVEFTINAPVFDENKMTDYLRIFAKMLLVAEDETITNAKVNGEEVTPY